MVPYYYTFLCILIIASFASSTSAKWLDAFGIVDKPSSTSSVHLSVEHGRAVEYSDFVEVVGGNDDDEEEEEEERVTFQDCIDVAMEGEYPWFATTTIQGYLQCHFYRNLDDDKTPKDDPAYAAFTLYTFETRPSSTMVARD